MLLMEWHVIVGAGIQPVYRSCWCTPSNGASHVFPLLQTNSCMKIGWSKYYCFVHTGHKKESSVASPSWNIASVAWFAQLGAVNLNRNP